MSSCTVVWRIPHPPGVPMLRKNRVPVSMGRSQDEVHPFARPDQVWAALLQVKPVAHVVQENAGLRQPPRPSRTDRPGSGSRTQRCRPGQPPRSESSCRPRSPRGCPAPALPAALPDIVLACDNETLFLSMRCRCRAAYPSDRRPSRERYVVRVAAVPDPVGHAQLDGLHESMDGVRVLKGQVSPLEALHQLEGLKNLESTGVGRRGENFVPRGS